MFTTWEDVRTTAGIEESSSEMIYKIYDYRPLLIEAGFDVEYYEETADWEWKQRGVYLAILARRDEIFREMGELAASSLVEEAQYFTELHDGRDRLAQIRRILVVARRD